MPHERLPREWTWDETARGTESAGTAKHRRWTAHASLSWARYESWAPTIRVWLCLTAACTKLRLKHVSRGCIRKRAFETLEHKISMRTCPGAQRWNFKAKRSRRGCASELIAEEVKLCRRGGACRWSQNGADWRAHSHSETAHEFAS